MTTMTHTGILEGCDARTPENCRVRRQLRETKLYWISQFRHRYSKKDGYATGDWPMYKLNLASIRSLLEEE